MPEKYLPYSARFRSGQEPPIHNYFLSFKRYSRGPDAEGKVRRLCVFYVVRQSVEKWRPRKAKEDVVMLVAVTLSLRC